MRCTDRVQHEAAPEMPLERAVHAAIVRACAAIVRGRRACSCDILAAIAWRVSSLPPIRDANAEDLSRTHAGQRFQ